MKYKDFRSFKIVRNCNEKYKDYKSYLSNLSTDFKHRCAYCNTHDQYINESYQIDHFIPQQVFKNTDMEKLKYDYNNLMYCCPKCNKAKGFKYKGNIYDGSYQNELFYNPVDTDYNEIFYRNEFGKISSEDSKGKYMIINMKLYSQIYDLAFLIEEISEVLNKIKDKVDKTLSTDDKQYYSEAYIKLNTYLLNLTRLFNCNYYHNSVKENH